MNILVTATIDTKCAVCAQPFLYSSNIDGQTKLGELFTLICSEGHKVVTRIGAPCDHAKQDGTRCAQVVLNAGDMCSACARERP